MANKVSTRVRVTPSKAKAGEVVKVQAMIRHNMESGQRKAKDGSKIPRKIVNRFTATYAGREIMSSEWHPAVSANPILTFYTKAKESGTIEFKWIDDDGSAYTASTKLTVE